ncbi:3-keto-5-aminohexanoate cleavage protein [Jannaschia sp.]|nr:3-keto-5-aminohexanoate cleavage protein [Jannaschia sp.]
MVAPNGARRGQTDHPAIPITDDALIETTLACHRAGADGVHAHIRDKDGRHLIDAGRYRALTEQLNEAVPGLYVQITSESAGLYTAEAQREMIRTLRPAHVSVALREMVRTSADWPEAQAFYGWAAEAEVGIQHIVYAPAELDALLDACDSGRIPGKRQMIQLVLGSYGGDASDPRDLAAFTDRMTASDLDFDWMLCAFGATETACLVEASRLGGKVRVGFENSLWNADGTLARDNAERVREVADAIARNV